MIADFGGLVSANLLCYMNCKNATYVNECIKSMILRLCNHPSESVDFEWDGVRIIDDADDVSGFSSDFELVKEVFGCPVQGGCCKTITKNDIMRQLVVIDSLYSTNINRMRVFALDEICEDIWNLCDNGNGVHGLGILTSKINATQALGSALASLFTKSYGYIRGAQAGKAPSLISKYLFMATLACPADGWGFPIYDSIASNLLRKVQRFLGISVTPVMDVSDIDTYIAGLKSIIDALESNNLALWSNLPVLKFQLLDYFLWHIGKAGKKSYSLLLSRKEVQTCYSNGVIVKLPRRIAYWQSIYNKLKQK